MIDTATTGRRLQPLAMTRVKRRRMVDTTGHRVGTARQRRGTSEAELILSAQRGDHRSFTALLQSHDDRMRGLAWQLLKDPDAMDDALQDAYLRAYRQIGTFRADAKFSSWLYRIVHNSCIDMHRRAARYPAATNDIANAVIVSPVDHADQLASRDALTSALASLPLELAAVIALVDGEGLPYDAVAELLGVESGTVGSRLSRARAALRTTLNQEGTNR